MTKRITWAHASALTAAVAIGAAGFPVGVALAQETPTQALEQARSGEDGTSGAGAGSGNMTTGNAHRDANGNGGSVSSAGSAGESGASGSEAPAAAPLPENAEVLAALGVLDEVQANGLTILTGLEIPVELLPPPPAEPVSSAPVDVNTGGVGGSGETSSVSTEPGMGSAPAGGSISSAAEDGVGSSSNGERKRDRNRDNADGATDTAVGG